MTSLRLSTFGKQPDEFNRGFSGHGFHWLPWLNVKLVERVWRP